MSYTKTDMLSNKIIEIIKLHGSPERPLTQQQICEYLLSDYALKPNRKTVAEHLKGIIAENESGKGVYIQADEVLRNGKPYCTNFYFDAEMTDGEFEFLTDSVIYSPTIPQVQIKKIIEALKLISAGNAAGKLANLEDTFHYNNQSILRFTEDIKEAIRRGKKIDVTMGEYDPKGMLVDSNDNPFGIKVHRLLLSPYGIVMSDGFYYLLANNITDRELRHYRMDKITDVKTADDEGAVRPIGELENIPQDFKPEPYKNLNRYMLDGKVERVHVTVKKENISLVLDTFGNEFACCNVCGNDEVYDVTFRANIQTVMRWVIANRKYVKLTLPKRAVDMVKEEISALSEMYEN